MNLRTLVLGCLLVAVEVQLVASTCCKMSELYLESAKLTSPKLMIKDVCGTYETIDKCLDEKNTGTCEWYCYLKKAEKQPEANKADRPSRSASTQPAKEYVYSEAEMRDLSSASDDAYYSKYQLLTADNKGEMTLFDFDPSIAGTRTPSIVDALLAAFHKLFDKEESKRLEYLSKKLKEKPPSFASLIKACSSHGTIHSLKCEEAVIKRSASESALNPFIKTRRLMSGDELDLDLDVDVETPMMSRRRLATGAESTVGALRNNLPYSAVGLLVFKAYDPDGATDGETWEGVATVIKSVKEGLHWFDYLVTAGHNCWESGAPAGQELSYDFKFYRKLYRNGGALPAAPTHTAARMERLWLPLYKAAGGAANDFCILKYRVAAQGVTVQTTDSATRRTRMRLITYRLANSGGVNIGGNPYRMRKVENIVPDLGGGMMYNIDPYYTTYGMSGSSLFIETGAGVTNIVCAVHTGNNGVGGAGKRSVHMRLDRERINIIDNILTNKWQAHSDEAVTRAMALAPNMLHDDTYVRWHSRKRDNSEQESQRASGYGYQPYQQQFGVGDGMVVQPVPVAYGHQTGTSTTLYSAVFMLVAIAICGVAWMMWCLLCLAAGYFSQGRTPKATASRLLPNEEEF